MSLLRFPLTAAPTRHDSGLPGANLSPLAQLLTACLADASGRTLAYDLVSPVMQACMALGTAHPFDINERVVYVRGSNTFDWSLLEAVLRLTNFHAAAHIYRPWPTAIEGFGPQLLDLPGSAPHRPLQVDTEWVAAALVAMGANPWTEAMTGSLPEAVQVALENGMAGLVERFLACPGAWPAQAVADATFTDRNGRHRSAWAVLVEREEVAPTLAVLLQHGARPASGTPVVDVLIDACPAAVEILAPCLPPLSPVARKAVESGWRARATGHRLDPQGLDRMSAALWGADRAEEFSATSVAVAKDLAVAWGSAANGSSSQAYDFKGNVGVAALVDQGKVKTGPMAGQWSGLAAAAFSRVRQASSSGALPWSVELMMHRRYEQGSGWQQADSSQPPYRGALAPALGFEWRPGIAVDALVMLALLGQQLEPSTAQHLQAFSQTTGVGDLNAWARRHVAGAVKVTQLVCSGTATTAAQCMLHVWNALFERTRKADVASALSPQQRFDLLYALTAKFKASDPWSSDSPAHGGLVGQFRAVAKALFPELSPFKTLLERDPTAVEFRAALTMVLACSRDAHALETVLTDLAEVSSQLPEEVFGLVDAWLKATTALTPAAVQRGQTWIRTWRLDQRLPAAGAPSPGRPKPRF